MGVFPLAWLGSAEARPYRVVDPGGSHSIG
jgi:hypothetical protein